MAARVIDDSKLQNIAVAIQSKDNGGQMTVDEMPGRIEALPTGATLISKTIAENGIYNAADDNADGYDEVTVNVQPFFYNNGVMYFSKMIFPDSVTTIKQGLYTDCVNMETVIFSKNVLRIEQGTFARIPLKNIEFKSGMEFIGINAFSGHKCQLIKLPSSIKTIQNYAFSSIAKCIFDLTSFTDPNSIPTLSSSAGSVFNLTYGVKEFQVINQEMYDVFTTATKWSVGASKFVIKGAT